MSEFSVAYSNGKNEQYSGDSSYVVKEGSGILVIQADGRKLTFSPAGWLCVEESAPKSAYEDNGPISL